VNAWSLAAALVLLGASRAAGQHVSGGVQLAFAEYAEQGPALRFVGAGASGHLALSWRRYGVTVGAARIALRPHDGAAADPFNLTQTDVRLRVRATRLVSVEAGFLNRSVDPVNTAQSMAAARVGAVLAFPLAVGSDVAVRASYLGGGKFSGGGSAPFGVEVGLAASYAPWIERVRLTGDLEFQRLDRRISTVDGWIASPIQSSIARIGVQVAY
jgi:hypothetical protein